jgi:hypothetical protein
MNFGAKQARVKKANAVIKIISEHGRRFFYSSIYDRTSKFGLDRHGQTWYVDDHSGMKLYPFHVEKKWPGFTHGGTLKNLVAALAQYIATGEKLAIGYFPLEHDAHLWAYGQDVMQEVRRLVMETGVVIEEQTKKEPA